MASYSAGRHRAPGRFNPVSELADIAAKAVQPAVKTSAVLVASGGLVASFALPAAAAPVVEPATNGVSVVTAPVAVQAPAAAAPRAADAFGVIGFTATAKPKPKPKPKPRARPVVAPVVAETRAPATASRSTQRQAPAAQAAPKPVVKPSSKPAAGGVLGIAAQYAGIMYVYGGTTPAGFDCSGFTSYVFRQVGINLPRTAEQQRQAVTPVSNPQPGDLVFFGAPAYHMGIYAGNGMMWDSPRSGKAVALRSIWSTSVTYGRP